MADIKPEIKVEGTRDMNEVDEFEEDTDLHMPAPGGQAWLVKVPRDMWQAWNTIYANVPDDNGRVQIGSMRVYHPKNGQEADVTKQRIEIRLDNTISEHKDIAKNYDLNLTTSAYANTLVFGEKDLPGHRSTPFGRGRYLQPNRPSGIPSKDQRYGRSGDNTNSTGGKPGYRTAIPKQTFLAPIIAHEANAAPKEDDEYMAMFQAKWKASIAPKNRTTYIEGIDRAMHPGIAGFSSFGLSSRPGGAGGKAGQRGGRSAPKEKAVRMDHAVLIDALENCFRRYKYWSLKALRNELKQPESYIRETLDNIATLVRSGDFANAYVLKPEYASIVKDEDDVKDEAAKIESEVDMGTGDEMGDDGDDGDDDGGDFEDVKMEGAG